MLDSTNEPKFCELIDDHPLSLIIPPKIQLELRHRGTMSTCNDDGRIAPRFRCEGPAILKWQESPRALPLQFPTTQVVVRNISRTGFSVLADRQWYPEQVARLYLPIGIALAKVVRAKRLGERCYDIGFRIVNYRKIEPTTDN